MTQEIIIETKLGKIKGMERTNVLTESIFYSFQGIPYAAPPVGEFRFRPPQPHNGWDGTLDATKEGDICAQNDMMLNMALNGSDDCLFLNIYTPSLTANAQKPIMVFVHGGGFTFGHSGSMFYGPDLLIAKDVILITINYRLNIFGFLNLGLEDCPGNVGLKDIIAALKWIKLNIESFGGDSNNITLFGQSAGAASVHYLMLSNPARGLFHKAILQSGTALDSWAHQTEKDSINNALSVARNLGCEETDLKIVLNFLKTIPALELVKHQSTAVITAKKIRKSLVFPFVPSIETIGDYQQRVITDFPTVLLKQNPPLIPFICGINSQESLLLLKSVGSQIETVLSSLENDFERCVPVNFNADGAKEKMIGADIRRFFFGDQPISLDSINEYFDLYSDIMFSLGHYELVSHVSSLATNSAYVYLFSYEGTLNIFKNTMNIGLQLPGACHVDEIGYLFYISLADLKPEPGSVDEKVSENIRSLWTNFAKTGVPNTDTVSSWKPCQTNNINYLNIDSDLTVQSGFIFQNRYEFWKQLYNKYQPNFLKEKL